MTHPHDESESDDSSLRRIETGLNDLRHVVSNHIASTTEYRTQRDKLMEAVTTTLWDKDGRPGAMTQLDRLIQVEKSRNWLSKAFAGSIVGLIAERIYHAFK